MKVGDLVKLDPSAYRGVDHNGSLNPTGPNTPGIVLEVYEPPTDPLLVDVLWPDGRTQRLYSDELSRFTTKGNQRKLRLQ
jgi:hypothetical protein